MSLELSADLLLVLSILALGVWVLAARDAFGAILGFVAYGLLIAIAWMRLGAADVALTEAAIGSGLTGLLLFGAAAQLRSAPPARPTPCKLRFPAVVLSVAVTIGVGAAFLSLPEPAPNLVAEAQAPLHTTGLGNAVTGVLIAYRAIDTLLEKLVLIMVLIGLWSLTEDRDWGGRPALRLERPTGALVLLARILPPLGILIGIHLLWVGAKEPGGAFQGGAVLAAMWALVLLAGLARAPSLDSRTLRWIVAAGPLLFLVVGVSGFFVADGFLAYPPEFAKPLIVAVEAALILSIAAILGLLIAGPAQSPSRTEPPA